MIIGLNGLKGSGKDTAADRIEKLLDMLYTGLAMERRAFAAPLKEIVARSFGITVPDVENWKDGAMVVIERAGTHETCARLTFREFLQRFGTEAMRDYIGNDVWVDLCLPLNEGVGYFAYKRTLCVVTDCRFVNEAVRIRDLGGQVWNIEGKNDDKSDQHASEQMLPNHLIHAQIDNTIHDDNYKHLDEQIARRLTALVF